MKDKIDKIVDYVYPYVTEDVSTGKKINKNNKNMEQIAKNNIRCWVINILSDESHAERQGILQMIFDINTLEKIRKQTSVLKKELKNLEKGEYGFGDDWWKGEVSE